MAEIFNFPGAAGVAFDGPAKDERAQEIDNAVVHCRNNPAVLIASAAKTLEILSDAITASDEGVPVTDFLYLTSRANRLIQEATLVATARLRASQTDPSDAP